MDTFYNIYITYFNNNYARILFLIVFILLAFKIAFFPSETRNSKKLCKSLAQEELKKLNPELKNFFIENTKGFGDSIKYGILKNLNGMESKEEILKVIEEIKKNIKGK